MKIPKDCTISLGTEQGTGTSPGIQVMSGSFRITTKADCDAYIKALEQIGSVLAERKRRTTKSSPRSAGTAKAA